MIALIGTSVFGAILACVAVLRLSETYPASQFELAFTSWTVIAGCLGALGGFWSACERWFGFAGPAGWGKAVVGALMVSGVGSVLAGSLILPIYGTMFGPLQLITTLIDSPALAILWCVMLICVHRLLRSWRMERDSIFAMPVA